MVLPNLPTADIGPKQLSNRFEFLGWIAGSKKVLAFGTSFAGSRLRCTDIEGSRVDCAEALLTRARARSLNSLPGWQIGVLIPGDRLMGRRKKSPKAAEEALQV